MWSAKVTTGLPDDDIAGDHIATLTAGVHKSAKFGSSSNCWFTKFNKAFALYGIDRDEPLETVVAFAKRTGVTYPCLLYTSSKAVTIKSAWKMPGKL